MQNRRKFKNEIAFMSLYMTLIISILYRLITFDNWYYTMFSLKKTRKSYQKPRINEALVDLEGLICQSDLWLGAQVDEHKNINSLTGSETEGKAEPLYFEF